MSLCLDTFTAQAGLTGSLFAAGLFSGFTHCAGMCGPFVLSQTQNMPAQPAILSRLKAAALFPYHIGRLTTYVLLAVLFQSLLGITALFGPVKAVLTAGLLFVAALIFLVNVVPSLARVLPWLANIRLPAPIRLIMKATQPILDGGATSPFRRYLLGLLLGFIPCGMVVAALLATAGAATPLRAGTAMLAFGLGTLPGLWSVAMCGQVIFRRWPTLMPAIKTVMMSVSILVLLVTAGRILFLS